MVGADGAGVHTNLACGGISGFDSNSATFSPLGSLRRGAAAISRGEAAVNGWRNIAAIDECLCVAYIGNMQQPAQHTHGEIFGENIRKLREKRMENDTAFSLRQVATRCGITPAYLSRVERGEVAPPGEETLIKLAHELGEDPDVLLAQAGKISADLRSAILARPQLFAELIRAIKTMPDNAVLRIVRDVRDGNW